MVPRYSRKEMAQIWSAKNKFKIWLKLCNVRTRGRSGGARPALARPRFWTFSLSLARPVDGAVDDVAGLVDVVFGIAHDGPV